MGTAPHTALPWTLFSTDLRPLDAGAVGLSVFLLVSIRVGDRHFGAVGAGLSEAQDLGRKLRSYARIAGRVMSMLPCRPRGEDVTRRQHTGRVTLKVGFVVRVVVRSFTCYCWLLGLFVVAVVEG